LSSFNKKPRALLLDLDGTLLDTAPDFAVAINRLRHDQSLPPLAFSSIRPRVSDGTQGMLSVGLGITPESPLYETHKATFLKYYQEHLSVHTQPFPGILALLAQWEQMEGPWGVVTNKPGWLTDPLLELQGLAHRASCVVSGDTLPVRKPSPLPLLHAAEALNLAPEQCVYVGDNLRDIEAGLAANMVTVAAAYGYLTAEDNPYHWKAKYVINQPQQIWSCLQHDDRK
jgi:2-phosphoglycolate phosphatase